MTALFYADAGCRFCRFVCLFVRSLFLAFSEKMLVCAVECVIAVQSKNGKGSGGGGTQSAVSQLFAITLSLPEVAS